MWDTVQTSTRPLSHDLPCAGCGHARHTYLACSDTCTCEPQHEYQRELRPAQVG